MVDLQLLSDASCLSRFECLVQAGGGMRVQLIHHQHNLLCLSVPPVHQILDEPGPVTAAAAVGHLHMTPASQRLKGHEQIRRSIAHILAVITHRHPRLRWQWRSNFTDQLLAGLIHADHWTLRILRPVIHLKHVFHRRHKPTIRLRRDAPHLFQPGLELVFFRTRRTVSCESLAGVGEGDYDPALIPAASTISDILRRHGLIDPEQSYKHTPFVRFEQAQPNDLWQMDFLGHFPLDDGHRCHTLTVLDDHSRFCLVARACTNQTGATVQQHLSSAFRRYGLPRRILSDNGSPWGCDSTYRYTWLSAWLISLGIGISHGRPYHPQTQGKDERFNRTLKAEAIGARRFGDIDQVQRSAFDPWREVYNLQRPHEALAMATPAIRYAPSPRLFPEQLPPIEYGPSDIVRRVQADGYFSYKTIRFKISQAFTGHPVALRPTNCDGQLAVFFCHQKVATIDLRSQTRIG